MSKTLFILITIFVLQIADAHQCNDDFINKVVEIFTEKVVCAECAEDGSCLGQMAPVSDHCLMCNQCRSGFKKDRRGYCRFVVRGP